MSTMSTTNSNNNYHGGAFNTNQLFRYSGEQKVSGESSSLIDSIAVPLKMDSAMPQETYTFTRDTPLTSVHWGQRKLLLSEIEMLLFYAEWGVPVQLVYAGAAPGTHLQLLSRMFPFVRFDVVDPAPFAEVLTKNATSQSLFRVRNCLFTDRLAHEFVVERMEKYGLATASTNALATVYRASEDIEANSMLSKHMGLRALCHASISPTTAPRLFFVSDIRSGSESDADFEDHVGSNMRMQAVWHSILRPSASMLKFRLPFPFRFDRATRTLVPSGITRVPYLSGDVLLPIWGRQTTTETRLVVPHDAVHVDYDVAQYDGACNWFNNVLRQRVHFNYGAMPSPDLGLDHRYDAAAEVAVLGCYVALAKREVGGDRWSALQNTLRGGVVDGTSDDDIVSLLVREVCYELSSTVADRAQHRDECIRKKALKFGGPQQRAAEQRMRREQRERDRPQWWKNFPQQLDGNSVNCGRWSLVPW